MPEQLTELRLNTREAPLKDDDVQHITLGITVDAALLRLFQEGDQTRLLHADLLDVETVHGPIPRHVAGLARVSDAIGQRAPDRSRVPLTRIEDARTVISAAVADAVTIQVEPFVTKAIAVIVHVVADLGSVGMNPRHQIVAVSLTVRIAVAIEVVAEELVHADIRLADEIEVPVQDPEVSIQIPRGKPRCRVQARIDQQGSRRDVIIQCAGLEGRIDRDVIEPRSARSAVVATGVAPNVVARQSGVLPPLGRATT